MTFTVTPLMSTIDLAESATPWSSAALDPDFFKQGNNSAAFYMSKNARGSETVTPSSSVAWSSYTYPHLYFWMNSSVAARMEPMSTGTTTAAGVTMRVTLASGAYREWHITGSDYWAGDWEKCFVLDMNHTGTYLYASGDTGTAWANTSNIASITWYFDLSNSGSLRNVPANCWLDAIRVGEGLQVHNTSAADAAFDFADIAAADENVSNQYGVFRSLEIGAEGSFGAQGKLIIGDSSSTNHLDFNSTDELVVFLERDGSVGNGLVHSSLYTMVFEGNSTGTDQDVVLGTKVGTGDVMSGRNGTQIRAGGSSVSYSVDLSDTNLHSVGWYGSTIAGADLGVAATGVPTTLYEIGGCTFDACLQVDTDDAAVRNTNFLNTVAAATSGAMLWTNGTTDAKYCLYVNNAVAIEIPASLSGDVSFLGMEFSGNTKDVRYEGAGGPYNLNWSDATGAPVIEYTSGVLTAVNTVVLKLQNVVSGSQCAIYAGTGGDLSEGTQMMNEVAGGGDVTEDFAYTNPQNIIIRVRKASAATKYRSYNASGQVTADGFTLRVDQIADPIIQ